MSLHRLANAITLVIILGFMAMPYSGNAQVKNVPFQRLQLIEWEESVASTDSIKHTSLKPFIENRWNRDSITGNTDTRKYYYAFGRKMLRDDLVEIKGDDYRFTFNPLWDFQLGRDFADTTSFKDSVQIFVNTRGLIIEGDIGKKVSFSTSVYENQARYPLAYQRLVDSLQVIPGQGRIKPQDDAGWDFNSSYGYLSVQAMPWLNVQIGHGKHFIGHGYRSLLLSDNAFNYPYLKGTAQLLDNRIQYMWMYSTLQVLQRLPLGEVPESLFKRKGASFHSVSFIPHPRVEIGLFESMVWNDWNDSTGTQAFEGMKLNPLIGLNTALNNSSERHHATFGGNLKIKISQGLQIYGQAVMDFTSGDTLGDAFEPAFGFQAGFKAFNVLIPQLDFQAEYNQMGRTSYQHHPDQETRIHMSQSLAHPLVSGFEEWVVIGNYRYKRFFSQAKAHMQKQEYRFDQPVDKEVQILDVQAGILLNPKTNMNVALGYMYRDLQEMYNTEKTQWVYFTFRTSLHNKYFDF